jgi:hypothetical protein
MHCHVRALSSAAHYAAVADVDLEIKRQELIEAHHQAVVLMKELSDSVDHSREI